MLRIFQSVGNCYTKLFPFLHSNIRKEKITISLEDKLMNTNMKQSD
nr:MAG TPA: hypothetical protein [Caudoviricetes sp.]